MSQDKTALPDTLAHICVDMQEMFAGSSPWAMPWMDRTVPQIVRLMDGGLASRTIFTRFIPARDPSAATGAWRDYYRAWPDMTLDRIDASQLQIVDALRSFCPPAVQVDKHVYSPWLESGLEGMLKHGGIDTLLITGGETDVCVQATVSGAVDRGYRTIIVEDAVCGSADETHDAMMKIYRDRLSRQIEVWTVAEVVQALERRVAPTCSQSEPPEA